MTEKNKALGLMLKKTTLRVLNVDELPLVGGASDDTGITLTRITRPLDVPDSDPDFDPWN